MYVVLLSTNRVNVVRGLYPNLNCVTQTLIKCTIIS